MSASINTWEHYSEKAINMVRREELSFARMSQLMVATYRSTGDVVCIHDLYMYLLPFTSKIVNSLLWNWSRNVSYDIRDEMLHESYEVLDTAVKTYNAGTNNDFVKYYSVILQRHLIKMLNKEYRNTIRHRMVEDYEEFAGCVSTPSVYDINIQKLKFKNDLHKLVFFFRFLLQRAVTQQEVAGIIGTTQSRVSMIENSIKAQLENGHVLEYTDG